MILLATIVIGLGLFSAQICLEWVNQLTKEIGEIKWQPINKDKCS